MVVFNPEVPEGKDKMPAWTNVTKPVSDIQADKSSGIALASLGENLGDAAGIVDTTVKDMINKDVRSSIEPIREDFTNQLLATKAMIQGAGSALPSGKPLDLVPPQSQSVPAGIDKGLTKVASLEAFMKSGNGKTMVDEGYYDMRLKNEVTALRSRYRGYEDYIDQRVAAITGMNPANELIRDTARQIAQLQSTKKSEFDRVLSLSDQAQTKGLQNADKMHEALLQRGEAFVPQWRQWYTEENAKFTRLQYQEAVRKAGNYKKEDFIGQRTSDWSNEVGTAVSNNMNTILSISGVGPMSIVQLMEDAANNPGKYKEEQMREFAMKVKAQQASVNAALTARATKTERDDQGKVYSYNSDITAPKVQEIQKNIVDAYYDKIFDALWNGGAGGAGIAFYHTQRAAAMLSTTKDEIYSGPAGEDIRKWTVLQEGFGQQAVPTLMQNIIKSNIDKKLNGLFENDMLGAKIQEKPNQPVTMKGIDDKLMTLEEQGQITKAMRSRYIQGGMNIMLKDITDASAPTQSKVNALRFFFSPEGQNVLNRFNNDRNNPISGKFEPGKQTVWNRLTSDDVVKSVVKLSQEDPAVGQMYKNWIQKEAGAQLFYKELLDLNTFTGRDDLYFKYNDGKKGGVPHIELLSDKGALESPVGKSINAPQYGVPQYGQGGVDPNKSRPYEGQIKRVQATVNRINEALRGLDRVERGFNGDSSAELLRFMISSQVDLGKNWEGLPAALMDAISASQGKGALQKLYKEKEKK